MSRIVIDGRKLSGSTGRYTRELLKELEQLQDENEYHVVIHTSDQTHYVPSKDNFYLHVVPYDSYTFGEQLGFARFLYKLRPDLVHFTMPQQPLLYFGKRVTTIHDLTLVNFQNLDKNKVVYTIEQTIFKFLLKNVARRSKVVITPTKFVKEEVAEYANISLDKIVFTHEAGAPLKKLKPAPIKVLEGKQFLCYVGNAFPYKNVDRLVEAFKLLKEKYPKLHLGVAGKKEFFYTQLEEKHKDVKDFHVLGFISDEQMAWFVDHAQAYVFPSLSEGFGLGGIDAMQRGAPLVASNASCLPEVYDDAAHYFDPESTEDMARAIDEVLRSKSRREALVKNGYERLKHFSWEKLAKKTHSVYLKALKD